MPQPRKKKQDRESASPERSVRPVNPGRTASHCGHPWLLAGLLLLLVFALYAPAVYHDFVNYDDSDYVTGNSQVLNGLNAEGLKWAFTSGHASNWHPLTWISHQLDAGSYGSSPGGHHLTSILFHVLNSGLLFLLLRELTGASWRALLVCALFALHPLRVESVAWVSERKDVLSGCFFLLTLWAYQRFARADRNLQSIRRSWFAASLLFFSLGLLSKPMLVTVPFVLLLLDYWPLRRVEVSQCFNIRVWLPLITEKVPFFALAIASSIITFLVQREGGSVSASISLGARLANAFVAHARYLKKLFLPNDLAVLYPHPGSWPVSIVTASVILAIVVAGWIWWQRGKRPHLLVGYLWSIGMLVPVIGIVQVGIQSMADRYTYLPMIGLTVALVWALGEMKFFGIRPILSATAALMVCCALSLLTARQVNYWRNSETLFTRTVEVTPNNYLAYNNLGHYLEIQGKSDLALEHYRKSVNINPLYDEALNNLGHALASRKQYAEAIELLKRAVASKPNEVEAHNNLGNALSEIGQIDEAIPHYQFVLEKEPMHANANNNYGIALAMKGDLPAAITHFQRALEAKRDYAGAYSNLGNAYAVSKRLEEAEQAFRRAMELDPKEPKARNNYGNVLAERGRLPEAAQQYEVALRLRSENPEAHMNLAVVLFQLQKTAAAREHLETALRQRPNYPEAARLLSRLTGGSTSQDQPK